jgi:hypothetical protein
VNAHESYPKSTKSGLALLRNAVLLLPGVFVGAIVTIAAIAEWCLRCQFPYLRSELVDAAETQIYTQADQATPFTPPTYVLPPSFSINQSHAALRRRWYDFCSRITSSDKWQDPAIRREFGEILADAHQEMHLLFQHAARAAGNEPQRMAQLMEDQHVWSDPDGENYCRAFFYSSIGPMFYAVRMAEYYQRDGDRLFPARDFYPQMETQLKWENAKPFFTPGTPEYRWRRLYNDACGLIDRYPGLKEALRRADSRFVFNAFPHHTPSAQPCSWTSRPTL